MAKLYKTPQGVFYQEDNGRQIPISDPAMLRDLYSGRSGNQFDIKEMTASQALNSTNARSFPDMSGSSATAGLNTETPQDKYSIFNDSVKGLLQQFQNAPTSEEAYKALYKTQQQAASQGFMPLDPSLIGAAPGDIQQTRNTGIAMWEPEQNAMKAKIKADQDRAKEFVELAKVAKEFGESFAKTLPMDDATAESLTAMIGSGEKFDEDILTKWSNSNYLKMNPGARTKALQGFAASKAKADSGTNDVLLNTMKELQIKQLLGELTPSTGQIVRKSDSTPVKLSQTQSQYISDYKTFLDNYIPLASTMLDTVSTGGVSGRYMKMALDKPLLQQTLSADAGKLVSSIATMANALIYLRSGKQINENEFARLKAELPDPTLTTEENKNRIKKFNDSMSKIYNNYLNINGWSEYGGQSIVPQIPQSPTTGGNITLQQQVTAKGYDYNKMKADGNSDEEIKKALGL